MRLFLDTNVLISGVVFGGVPRRLVEAARDGRIEGVISLYVLTEFVEVLTRPRFGVAEAVAVGLAEELAEWCEVVALSRAVGSWVSDPGDDPVIEASVAARVHALVTGDAALLAAAVSGLRIVTPVEALRLMERE